MREERGESRRRAIAAPTVKVPEEVAPLLRRIGQLAHARGVQAYAVGGCVRDWLLGLSKWVDLDIVVVGDGVAFAREAASALNADLVEHAQFGTATLVIPSASRPMRIDIATARKESYREPAAYPKVSPGSLRDDLLRRDVTINAMAMAVSSEGFGTLVDPFGGANDLRRRRLRVLHAKSFEDDPSRMLRAARFVVRFNLTVEAKTARALRRAVEHGLLARLNRGRLRKELERIVEEPDPIACLERLGRWLNA